MSDLAYLPAVEAIARFRARDLSPVELLDALIGRAEEVEGTVNALSHRRFDEARVEARAAEARYLGRGDGEPRPLEGIAVAIKDEMPIEGQPWQMGSLIYRDQIADETSPLAQRMLDAGAIVHARTTTPEFSCAGFTHSRLWGVTRNPWNPEFGVGGSSGGAGASLASGTSTLAGGSDIGGSIRIPASANGVVGFKAPYGRVPVETPFNLDVYCHNGALARTVADCALFENVLAGPHPLDHASLRPKLEIPAELEGIEGLRVALSPGLGTFPLDPEVDANTRAAAAALAEAGAIVEEVDLQLDREALRQAIGIHFEAIFGAWISHEAAQHRDDMCDYALHFAATMRDYAKGAGFLHGVELEARIQGQIGQLLERHDVLVCATLGGRGLVAGDGYVDHGVEVGGVQLDDYFSSILTPVFNVCSRCPVLAVPSGFAMNGVPTGIQIVGRTYDDVTTFRVGAALERLRPWLDTPARRPLAAGAAV